MTAVEMNVVAVAKARSFTREPFRGWLSALRIIYKFLLLEIYHMGVSERLRVEALQVSHRGVNDIWLRGSLFQRRLLMRV